MQPVTELELDELELELELELEAVLELELELEAPLAKTTLDKGPLFTVVVNPTTTKTKTMATTSNKPAIVILFLSLIFLIFSYLIIL